MYSRQIELTRIPKINELIAKLIFSFFITHYILDKIFKILVKN